MTTAASGGKHTAVPFDWPIKVTEDNEKYLTSTASEALQTFMSDLLNQVGATSLADELYARGSYASLNIPSAEAAEAKGHKNWKPRFEDRRLLDLCCDGNDMRTVLDVWRDACNDTASVHTRVMDALAAKLEALAVGKREMERKLAYDISNTTLENQVNLVHELDASSLQQKIGLSFHQAYLDALTSHAQAVQDRVNVMLQDAIDAAAQNWSSEHAMHDRKVKAFLNRAPESWTVRAHTRYFPDLVKHVMAMETACDTMKSLKELCEGGERLEQARKSSASRIETWTDRVTFYQGELDDLIKFQSEAREDLDSLSKALGLDEQDVETLQLDDLPSLKETEDAAAFRSQLSAIGESRRSETKPQKVRRPIAPFEEGPTGELGSEEEPRPDFSEVYDDLPAGGGFHYGSSKTFEDYRIETLWDWAFDLKPDCRPRAQSFGGYTIAQFWSERDGEAGDAAIESEHYDSEDPSYAA